MPNDFLAVVMIFYFFCFVLSLGSFLLNIFPMSAFCFLVTSADFSNFLRNRQYPQLSLKVISHAASASMLP